MSIVVEVDERGSIQLPDDILATIKPHSRFVVELQGERLVLHPEAQRPANMLADVHARVEALHQWVTAKRPSSPVLPDIALTREDMYDK